MIPNLIQTEFGFEGTLQLDVWKGFQTRNGLYGGVNSDEASDGNYNLLTGGDMVEDDPEIKDYHVKAYDYTVQYQKVIQNNILERLFKEYTDLQNEYGYDDNDKALYMPDITTLNDFKTIIGLANVHLLNVEKDGVGYVGYEFGCTWDDEHGVGFMTHKDKVISFGGSDSSFLTWIAKKDANPEANESEETDDQISNTTSIKKSWWKFWR